MYAGTELWPSVEDVEILTVGTGNFRKKKLKQFVFFHFRFDYFVGIKRVSNDSLLPCSRREDLSSIFRGDNTGGNQTFKFDKNKMAID